jgi:predicted HTH transcriptional regulator
MEELRYLLEELLLYPGETEWLEFKENWFDAVGLGEYVSALANSAALRGKENGYLVWGISNEDHYIVGTNFNFRQDYNREPLEHFWPDSCIQASLSNLKNLMRMVKESSF